MTTAVISQPMLFPWPGFFELVAMADTYVHLDDAPFSSNSFINRIQVKHATGWSWMTIPVRRLGLNRPINELVTNDGPWPRRNRALLGQSLAKSPYLDEALRLFDNAHHHTRLVDLLIASIEEPAKYLEIWKPSVIVRSSDLGVPGKGSQRVLDIVRTLGCTRYLTAHGAQNYLDHEAFERAGVTVEYIGYSMTPYRQRHGEFLPYVTVLDLVAALGPAAGNVLRPTTVPWREFLRNSGKRSPSVVAVVSATQDWE